MIILENITEGEGKQIVEEQEQLVWYPVGEKRHRGAITED